jgi:hypothetical protein
MAALDKLMRRSVSQISADRALLLTVRSSLHELRDLADAHANLVAGAAHKEANTRNLPENSSSSAATSAGALRDTTSSSSSSAAAAAAVAAAAASAAADLAERVRVTMHSNEMALFLDDGPAPEAPAPSPQMSEPPASGPSCSTLLRRGSQPPKDIILQSAEENVKPSLVAPVIEAPLHSPPDHFTQSFAHSAQESTTVHVPERGGGDLAVSSSSSSSSSTSAIKLSSGSQEFQIEPPMDGLVTADTDSDTERGCESRPKLESGPSKSLDESASLQAHDTAAADQGN